MILVKLNCIVPSAISKSLRNNIFQDELQVQRAPAACHHAPNESNLFHPDQEDRVATMNNSNYTIAGWFCNDGQRVDREDIAELICQGIEVDDDNEALPENVELDVEAQGLSREGVAV